MDMISTKYKRPPSFFPKGVLRFSESGHVLTTNGKYYVCSQKQKGKCELKEATIRADNFERTFSRLGKKLEIPEKSKDQILMNEALRQILYFIVDH